MNDKPIICDPAIKLGRPVVAGTRITVDEVLLGLAEGRSNEDLIEANPGLTREGIHAAMRFAAEAVLADSPLSKKPPLELHGAHRIELPEGTQGAKTPAIAVRAYLPDAKAAAVTRLPPPPSRSAAWLPALEPGGAGPVEMPPRPMERIHPEGVYEAVFPGETEPFPYRLEVAIDGQASSPVTSSFGLPPWIGSSQLPAFLPGGQAEAALQASRLHDVLGAHPREHAGVRGVAFAVWAPNAASVSVIGGFNAWNGLSHPMRPVEGTGVWELFIPGLGPGELYKYRIVSRMGQAFDKADPFAFAAERRPATASIVWDGGGYRWGDAAWMESRAKRQSLDRPIAIYEVHLGSWRREPDGRGGSRFLSYRELADRLIPYVKEMGYTHIEPLPVAEHPYDGSWGYQVTGFFAPTSRYGSPDDFRYFVDCAHRAGLGVILDWVAGHFPKDAHGLAAFDGTPLYEHPDPRRSENQEWGTFSFNLEREEVAAFLRSNAVFWIEQYHVDGLRIDAVSSMIYLDYSRQHWIPNEQGGRENLDAADFFRGLNALVRREHPGVLMIAEESTAWPHVTRRGDEASLGFDLKWNLGWMHDTLGYAGRDPVHRRFHHNDLTFSLMYAFSENFLLPFSHDEVVHGKRSMLSKMPGDDWRRFANLRLLYGYMTAHPGKKLHFMGAEFGVLREWSEAGELDWSLLARELHRGVRDWVKELNALYARQPALHEVDFGWEGFQWIDCDDAERSIISFLRRGKDPSDCVVVAANFTPVPREGYRLGVPAPGTYAELLNSDAAAFGGSGVVAKGALAASPERSGTQPCSLVLTLPPLGIVMVARERGRRARA